MDLFHLRLLVVALMCIGMAISLRYWFWNPKLRWCIRLILRMGIVGILSILLHGFCEEGMTWRASVGIVLCAMVLCESMYLWWITGIIQSRQLPVMFRYGMTRGTVSWPAHRHFLRLRDYLRREHFRTVGTFHISFLGVPLLLNVVMLDASGRVRLEVFFRLGASGIRHVQFVFSSRLKEDEWIVTDNVNVPSGGIMPRSWKLKRYRFASPQTLLRRHRKRLQMLNAVCETWDSEHILSELNREQDLLAGENFQRGLLERSSDGREYILSDEGRYRLWQSTLSIHYLGIA